MRARKLKEGGGEEGEARCCRCVQGKQEGNTASPSHRLAHHCSVPS